MKSKVTSLKSKVTTIFSFQLKEKKLVTVYRLPFTTILKGAAL
jgi:hypothetical protein